MSRVGMCSLKWASSLFTVFTFEDLRPGLSDCSAPSGSAPLTMDGCKLEEPTVKPSAKVEK